MDEVEGSSKKMMSQEEMVKGRIPLPYRNECAHLLIALRKCRFSEFFLPWKCVDEHDVLEMCENVLFLEKLIKMHKIRVEQLKLELQQKQGIPPIPKTANALSETGM